MRVLDRRGVLSQLKASLRHEVFMAIEEEDSNDTAAPSPSSATPPAWERNPALRAVMEDEAGATAMALAYELLESCGLTLTASVLRSEAGLEEKGASSLSTRADLAARFGDAEGPLLQSLARSAGGAGVSPARPPTAATRPVSAAVPPPTPPTANASEEAGTSGAGTEAGASPAGDGVEVTGALDAPSDEDDSEISSGDVGTEIEEDDEIEFGEEAEAGPPALEAVGDRSGVSGGGMASPARSSLATSGDLDLSDLPSLERKPGGLQPLGGRGGLAPLRGGKALPALRGAPASPAPAEEDEVAPEQDSEMAPEDSALSADAGELGLDYSERSVGLVGIAGVEFAEPAAKPL